MMFRYRIFTRLPLLVLIFLFTAPSYGLTVCLDLGNVVFNSNTGMPDWLVKRIKSSSYRFMEHVKPFHPHEVYAYDEHGSRFPQVMCDWQKGAVTTDIKQSLIRAVETDTTYFTLAVHKKLILYVINRIFTPEKVVESQVLNPEVMILVKFCKKRGYRIIIASNFPREEFELIRKKYADFFECCDGIHVSGHAKTMKPDPLFLEQIMDQYHLDPWDCVLFDDRPENRETAEKLGWYSFYKTKTTYGLTGPVTKTDFDAFVNFIKEIERQQTHNVRAPTIA